MGKRQKIYCGSFTVEAAMIMSLVLFVIFSVLGVTRTIYNRALCTAYGYEYAITKREKEAVGLWGTAEGVSVELEELKPVSFIRKNQIIMKEMR